jgi:hypothetical protein
MRPFRLVALSLAAFVSLAGTASADAPRRIAPPALAPEVAERAAAAYDQGTEAYRAGRFEQAAERFEQAYALAPAPEALVQAMRSHARAGHSLRALTLASMMVERYPDDENGDRFARPLLRELGARYVRIEAICVGCSVWVDGTRKESSFFYVEPGTEHVVEARFPNWTVRETVREPAGVRRTMEFEAPSRVEEVIPVPTPVVATDEAPSETNGWSSVVFWSGVGVTAALAGVTIWSGVDTVEGANEYERMPTQALLDDGRARELRTNVLIGVTAGVAVGTALVGIFVTDWSDGAFHASATPLVEGGFYASLGGRLP